VVWIDCSDFWLKSVIKRGQAPVFGITWFVDRVVPSDVGIVRIALGNFYPKPDNPVLEIFVLPEQGFLRAAVGMPIWILTSRQGMKIEDCVDTMLGALYRVSETQRTRI
jgi:hypothetical protein